MILSEQELAEIIDQWYFEWKTKFGGTPFGIAKENLKIRIADVEAMNRIHMRKPKKIEGGF